MLRFFQLENLCVYREVGADGARAFPAQWRSCTTPCGRCFLVRAKRLLARRCSCSPAYSDAPPRCSAAERGSFDRYNAKLFTWEDQVRLHSIAERAAAR